jgi:cob(I)alamin adenosyltransferase
MSDDLNVRHHARMQRKKEVIDQKFEAAKRDWDRARALLNNPAIGLVVLDELNIALKYRYLDVHTVLADIKARPSMQHVIMSGRAAPQELIDAADTVTGMYLLEHAFTAGIAAQPGVEW